MVTIRVTLDADMIDNLAQAGRAVINGGDPDLADDRIPSCRCRRGPSSTSTSSGQARCSMTNSLTTCWACR